MTKKDYERFLELSSALSPENLWMDGEATPAQAKTRERALTRRSKSLEQAVGRKVSEDEVWEWSRKQRNTPSGLRW